MHSDCEDQNKIDIRRQARNHKRRCSGKRLDRWVNRVLHQAVKAIHPLHAVVDCVKSPEKVNAVTGEVSERDAGVENDDGDRS